MCSWICERIELYLMNRRLTQKLKILEKQVATINLEHVEKELMGLQKQAQELFAHIDSTTGKKKTA